MDGVRDRDLFLKLLADGERSARFISPSNLVRERYGEHQVYFFYVRSGDEVARVETWSSSSGPRRFWASPKVRSPRRRKIRTMDFRSLPSARRGPTPGFSQRLATSRKAESV